MPTTVSIIIPVYFNAGSLPILFERLRVVEAHLKDKSIALELIFVDDGSQDASFNELLQIKAARPDTKVIKLTRNFGATHATKCGLQFISGDCFAILAADLQEPPELLLDLVDAWQHGSKFSICTRESRTDPWVTQCFSAIFYALLRKLVLPNYPKGGFTLALLDKALLEPIKNSAKTAYIPLLAFWLGFKPVVIPYKRAKRIHGKSRWTLQKKSTLFLNIFLGFSIKPIRLISILGALLMLGSGLLGLTLTGMYLHGEVAHLVLLAVTGIMTFLAGLIILLMGIIAEYVVRIYNEHNKLPEYVIEQVYD